MKNTIRKIVFFNPFHKGDLHVSRSLVKAMMEKLKRRKIIWQYAHKYDSEILKDLGLEQISIPSIVHSPHLRGFMEGDTLYLNTWYGADSGSPYLNQYGITFDCLYHLFNDHLKIWFGMELNEDKAWEYLPSIDRSIYHNEVSNQLLNFAERSSGPIVLVNNCQALSGQGLNVNFDAVTKALAEKFHGLVFVLTQKTLSLSNLKNIYTIDDISPGIYHGRTNLNEISIFSEHADIIFGTASGPLTFCFTQENLERESLNMLFFSNISYPSGKFWLGNQFRDKINYKASVEYISKATTQSTISHLTNLIQRKYS